MEDKVENKKKESQNIATGIVAGETTKASISRLEVEYGKPQQYTGNRRIYDSPRAKVNTKMQAFKQAEVVKDPYTEKILVLTKKEAKLKYGENWTEHLAESDHKVPIERIHKEYKDNPWVKNENIKDVANSENNMEVVSRKFNNAKRSRTNEELVSDENYLNKTGTEISDEGKQKAVKSGQKAKRIIDKKLEKQQWENIYTEAYKAGKEGAINAASMTALMSTMNNIVDVIKGNRKPEDALKNIAEDTIKAGATGFALTGTLSVVGHSLSNSSSEFIKALVKANAPAKVVTAVMATGDILCNFAKGKISSAECIVQLGERGTAAVVASYATVVGQAAIPIPLVGAAVGALVGTAVSGVMYSSLLKAIEEEKKSAEEYQRVKIATENAITKMEIERRNFINVTNKLFANRSNTIQDGLDKITDACMRNNFDKLTIGLNQILSSFGRALEQSTFVEFDELMNDDTRALEL